MNKHEEVIDYEKLLKEYYTTKDLDAIAVLGMGKVGALHSGDFLLLDPTGQTIDRVSRKKRIVRAPVNLTMDGWEFRWKNAHGTTHRGILTLSYTDDRTRRLTHDGYAYRVRKCIERLYHKGYLSKHDASTMHMNETKVLDWATRLGVSRCIHRQDAVLLFLLLITQSDENQEMLMQEYDRVFDEFSRVRASVTDADFQQIRRITANTYPVCSDITLRSIRRVHKAMQGLLAEC